MSGAVEHYPPNGYGYSRNPVDSRSHSQDIYNNNLPPSNRMSGPPAHSPTYGHHHGHGHGHHGGSPSDLGILSASQHRDAEVFHLKHENDYPSGSGHAQMGSGSRRQSSTKERNISAQQMPWKSAGMASGVPNMEERVWAGGILVNCNEEESERTKEDVRPAKRKKSDKSAAEPPKTTGRRASKASSTTSKGRKQSIATSSRADSEDRYHSSDDDQDKEDESDKRQRGRPRLETKDETAADRRRTQIRLAQRAYRQRKETTIVSLKKRVTELETAIDGMHNSFLELHDAAENMHVVESIPQFGRVLRTITEKFITMAKDAGKGALALDDDEDMKPPVMAEPMAPVATAKANNKRKREEEEPPKEEPIEKVTRSDSAPLAAPPDVNPAPAQLQANDTSMASADSNKWANEADLDNVAMRYDNTAPAPIAQEAPVSHVHPIAHVAPVAPPPVAPVAVAPPVVIAETSLVRKPNMHNMHNMHNMANVMGNNMGYTTYSFDNPMFNNRDFLPQNLFNQSIPPPMSVSEMQRHHDFQFPPITDPIFASRLGMSCLRYGYTLLHHPNSDPIAVMRAFAYGMLFSEKEELKHRISKMLRRKPGDPPVGLDFPVQNLGGSGLHYVFKRDASGQMIKVQPGPREMDKLNNKSPAALRVQLTKMGFANDAWKIIPIIIEAEEVGYLNPPDVEAWLMEKGVQLTPYTPRITVPAGIVNEALIPQHRSPSRGSNDHFSLTEEDILGANPNEFINNVMANAGNVNLGDTGEFGFGMNNGYLSPSGSGAHHQSSSHGRGSPIHNNSPPSGFNGAPFAPQPSYGAPMYPATKTLNVDLFIDELVKRCTCLGNVPGWQQSQIEESLAIAMS